ncbi:hypothetical protein HNQ36_005202 [Afipia massiliensis]|uniref:DUF1468 domain-containing protein n=1 Tax=Afipia massiliensis TaxID=211460 RepID=A0A840NC11_9BRAD|nr:tripartite tricarboxylate transporter TctB family protein [Afipia massiliensis]MBB5055191.1 hypothetical protein [Afipia massiliensis]
MIKIAPTYLAVGMLGALALIFGVGAFRLGFWGDDGPGPGLLPLVVSLLLVPMLVLVLREPLPSDETSLGAGPLSAIVLVLIYAAILPRAGFVLSTLVMLFAWIRLFYRQSWLRSAGCSASLTILGLVIFNVLLKVPMQLFPVLQ